MFKLPNASQAESIIMFESMKHKHEKNKLSSFHKWKKNKKIKPPFVKIQGFVEDMIRTINVTLKESFFTNFLMCP